MGDDGGPPPAGEGENGGRQDCLPHRTANGGGRGCPPGTNRGGGPKSDEGRETALANLEPKTAAITHGVNAYLASGTMPSCARCDCARTCPFSDAYEGEDSQADLNPEQICIVMQTVYQAEMREMRKQPHLADNPVNELLMDQRARMGAVSVKIQMVLAQRGLFRVGPNGLEAQPLMDTWLKIVGKLESVSDKLGLTPRSASQLQLSFGGDSQVDIRATIERLQQQGPRRPPDDVIDGEFEAE